jgi:hypothetical protein
MKNILVFAAIFLLTAFCKSPEKSTAAKDEIQEINTNPEAGGPGLIISFSKGEEHNHPLMAIWAEDTNGVYLQTIYVANSIARGIFQHGDAKSGKWMPGEIRRPAALPYWAHQRGIKASDGLYIPSPDNPLPDAVSGETPPGDFLLHTRLEKNIPAIVNIFFEINQSWDWNEYWTNNKFPENKEYKSSCQPAVVYMATVDFNDNKKTYQFKAIGHSHYAGKNGELYKDLSTLTTALEITGGLIVKER